MKLQSICQIALIIIHQIAVDLFNSITIMFCQIVMQFVDLLNCNMICDIVVNLSNCNKIYQISGPFVILHYNLSNCIMIFGIAVNLSNCMDYCLQSRSTPTSGPPPKVSARAPAHRSYHFRGVKLKSCIKKIHHNLYISKQANVKIKHADTEGASHKKFGTDARVQ